MYLVSYIGGDYGNRWAENIFVTSDEDKAQEYCERFNHILYKWKAFHIKNKSKYSDVLSDRKSQLESIAKCIYEEIRQR